MTMPHDQILFEDQVMIHRSVKHEKRSWKAHHSSEKMLLHVDSPMTHYLKQHRGVGEDVEQEKSGFEWYGHARASEPVRNERSFPSLRRIVCWVVGVLVVVGTLAYYSSTNGLFSIRLNESLGPMAAMVLFLWGSNICILKSFRALLRDVKCRVKLYETALKECFETVKRAELVSRGYLWQPGQRICPPISRVEMNEPKPHMVGLRLRKAIRSTIEEIELVVKPILFTSSFTSRHKRLDGRKDLDVPLHYAPHPPTISETDVMTIQPSLLLHSLHQAISETKESLQTLLCRLEDDSYPMSINPALVRNLLRLIQLSYQLYQSTAKITYETKRIPMKDNKAFPSPASRTNHTKLFNIFSKMPLPTRHRWEKLRDIRSCVATASTLLGICEEDFLSFDANHVQENDQFPNPNASSSLEKFQRAMALIATAAELGSLYTAAQPEKQSQGDAQEKDSEQSNALALETWDATSTASASTRCLSINDEVDNSKHSNEYIEVFCAISRNSSGKEEGKSGERTAFDTHPDRSPFAFKIPLNSVLHELKNVLEHRQLPPEKSKYATTVDEIEIDWNAPEKPKLKPKLKKNALVDDEAQDDGPSGGVLPRRLGNFAFDPTLFTRELKNQLQRA